MDAKTNVSAPKTWGVSSAESYNGLRDKPVQVVSTDNKLYRGVLVGVDQYDLILKQTSGAVILFAKHAVKFIQADAPVQEA